MWISKKKYEELLAENDRLWWEKKDAIDHGIRLCKLNDHKDDTIQILKLKLKVLEELIK